MIYSAVLRRSEVINLKVRDIDSSRMMVFIEGGKGNKDRYSILSEKLLDDLRRYFIRYRPEHYLFEGHKGEAYSPSSIRKIFKRACAEAGIKKAGYHSHTPPFLCNTSIRRRCGSAIHTNASWSQQQQDYRDLHAMLPST